MGFALVKVDCLSVAGSMRDSMTVMPATVELNLWKKRLGHVPDWVWERTEVETLILADNGLTEISERIGGLQRLRTLDLGHNQLSQLPGTLGGLVGLSGFLYLHDMYGPPSDCKEKARSRRQVCANVFVNKGEGVVNGRNILIAA